MFAVVCTIKLILNQLFSVAEDDLCFFGDCNGEMNDLTDIIDTFFSAASVASQWLELLQQDIKGRLSGISLSLKLLLDV